MFLFVGVFACVCVHMTVCVCGAICCVCEHACVDVCLFVRVCVCVGVFM